MHSDRHASLDADDPCLRPQACGAEGIGDITVGESAIGCAFVRSAIAKGPRPEWRRIRLYVYSVRPFFRRVPCTVLVFVSRYQVLSTWYDTTAVSGIYLVRYTYTSKDTALLFCFNDRIAYHGYTMCSIIRNDNVLLLWSTSLPGLTRYVVPPVSFQNFTERYVRQLTCKRIIALDDRA